ncbi:MAG TPA: hypothetical protein VM681_09030 [Candidatus Thermoplasmatota archaeon]|nr:hypothetical protein [Candidatus Thermoplasmatota archaeon]
MEAANVQCLHCGRILATAPVATVVVACWTCRFAGLVGGPAPLPA